MTRAMPTVDDVYDRVVPHIRLRRRATFMTPEAAADLDGIGAYFCSRCGRLHYRWSAIGGRHGGAR